MADIYGNTPTFGGAFAMDEATLTFAIPTGGLSGIPVDAGLGYLIQNVNVQYTRPVQRIFELGPKKTTYYVTGRAEGRMQIGRLAAPAPVNTAFLSTFANVCNVANNTLVITARPGIACGAGTRDENGQIALGSLGGVNGVGGQQGKPSRYTFNFCLIDAVQFQMSVQALALTENMSLVFAAMSIDSDQV